MYNDRGNQAYMEQEVGYTALRDTVAATGVAQSRLAARAFDQLLVMAIERQAPHADYATMYGTPFSSPLSRSGSNSGTTLFSTGSKPAAESLHAFTTPMF